MASVTFSVSVGGDGSTVTDDANATTGLANGGHRARFVPALSQVVAVAAAVVVDATQAAADAAACAADRAIVVANYDLFDDRWLGSKAANPTLDNDGAALVEGTAYWNSVSNQIRIWDGAAWVVQTFIPTAASGVTVAAGNGLGSTDVQLALEELAASANIYAHANLGGF